MTHDAPLPLAVSPELGGDDDDVPEDEDLEEEAGEEALGIEDEPELDVEVPAGALEDPDPDGLDVGELVEGDDETVGDGAMGLREDPLDEDGALDFPVAEAQGEREDEWDPVSTDDDDDPIGTADDRGAEGTGEDAAEFVDEQALPEPDRGSEGDLDMSDLVREIELGGDEDWEIQGPFMVEADVSYVDCVEGRVIAAGATLVSFDRGERAARARPLAEPALGCALVSAGAAFATTEGILLTSATFDGARSLWERRGIGQLARASDRLFALADRRLWQIEPTSGAAVSIREDVAGCAAAAGTLLAVVKQGAGHRLVRLRGHDGGWEDLGEADDLGTRVERGARFVANGGLSLAVLDRGRLLVGRAGRSHLRPLELSGVAGATFQGDDEGAALLVIEKDAESSRLVRVSQGDPMPAELCRLTGSHPRAIAWDATREIAFIADEGGLLAVGPRVRH